MHLRKTLPTMQFHGTIMAMATLCLLSRWQQAAAATRGAATRKENLLRRQRLRSAPMSDACCEEPFIVSFRVKISGPNEFDNNRLAVELAKDINKVDSPAAELLAHSVARVERGTFPPVQMPTTTIAAPAPAAAPLPTEVLAPVPAPAPAPGPGPAAPLTPSQSAKKILKMSYEAAWRARMNHANWEKLTHKMNQAALAHLKALNLDGGIVEEEKKPVQQYSLGRLVYDALINTPPPEEEETLASAPGPAPGAVSPAPAPFVLSL